jgi:hypothetical protein
MVKRRRKTKAAQRNQAKNAGGSPPRASVGLAAAVKKGLTNSAHMTSRVENGMVVTRVHGSDFLTALNVTTNPAAVTTNLALNAAYSLVYSNYIGPQFYSPSRITSLAPLWERYKVKSINYRYVPSVPATYTGQLMMVCDHDASDNLSALSGTESLARVMGAHYGSVEGQIWQPLVASLRDQDLQQNYYTDVIDPTDDAPDIRLCAQGRIDIALIAQITNGASTVVGGTFGDLYVDYEIDFFYPQIDEGEVTGGAMMGLVNPPNNVSPVTGVTSYNTPFLRSATGRFGAQWLAWWLGDTTELDQNRDSSLAALVTNVQLVISASAASWVLVTVEYLGELLWSGSCLDYQANASIIAPAFAAFANANTMCLGLIASSASGSEDSSSLGSVGFPYVDAPCLYNSTLKPYALTEMGNNSGLQPVSADGTLVFSPVSSINAGALNTSAALEYRFTTVSVGGLHQVAFLLAEPAGSTSITPNPQDTTNAVYNMVVALPDPPARIYHGSVPVQPSFLALKDYKNRKREAAARASSKTFQQTQKAKRLSMRALLDDCKTVEDCTAALSGTPHLLRTGKSPCAPTGWSQQSPQPRIQSLLSNVLDGRTVLAEREYVVLQPTGPSGSSPASAPSSTLLPRR